MRLIRYSKRLGGGGRSVGSSGWCFLVVVSLAVALLVSLESGAPRHSAPPHDGLPRWTPPQENPQAAPALFVAGDGKGGIGVYSTANGALIRTISPQGPGGPDQQVVLSRNRQSVFFTQPTGPCSGNILNGPVSGSSAPAVVISDPQTLALSPSPGPTSRELAWVGVTCGPTGSTPSSTLYITNLATGVRSDLGAFSGQHSDDEISWNSDGTRLAVESGYDRGECLTLNKSTPKKRWTLECDQWLHSREPYLLVTTATRSPPSERATALLEHQVRAKFWCLMP